MGILLHSRWTHVLFRPVSERLCVLDVKLTCETVSIFSVYMPHADYPDEDVDVVYTQLDPRGGPLQKQKNQDRHCR